MTGPIPQLVNVPSTSDPENFAAEADNLFGTQLPAVIDAMNDVSTGLNNLSTSSTSVTSNTIGTGSKAFTVETGKSYFEGQSLTIARTSAPTNRMFAVVDSYDPDTGALVVTSQAFEGSGTFTDWTITLGFNGVIAASQIADGAITADKILDNNITRPKLASGVLSYQSAVQTAAGTELTFSAIPSGITSIAIPLSLISTNGTGALFIQLGDSGGIENTGYSGNVFNGSASAVSAYSSSFLLNVSSAAARSYDGIVYLELTDPATNTWSFVSTISTDDASITTAGRGAGSKSLTGELTQILIGAAGTDVLDAGKARLIGRY